MSVTDFSAAIPLFVNRQEVLEKFLTYVHAEKTPNKIIYYVGAPGNGKSLVLQQIKGALCKRLSRREIQELSSLSTNEKLERMFHEPQERSYSNVFHSFSTTATSHDSVSVLTSLRKRLENASTHFPLFEFAWLWYLREMRELTESDVKRLVPPLAVDAASSVANTLLGTPWGAIAKNVLSTYQTKLDSWWTTYRGRLNVSVETLQEIQRMEPNSELINHLPVLFAHDLNTSRYMAPAIEKYDRIILLFDNHEALWGADRHLSESMYFLRDEWLRRLLLTLDLRAGIVVVVAGQEPPRWSNALQVRIPEERIELVEVSTLKISDAGLYLEKAGVDLAVSERLLKFAEVVENEIHPLLLGLATDVALEAMRNNTVLDASLPDCVAFESAANVLISRFLHYADADTSFAIKALCGARTFDRNVYELLGQGLSFLVSKPRFDAIRMYSFVIRDGDSTRIHPLLARIIRDHRDCQETVRSAESLLNEYYEKLSEIDQESIVDAIYYRCRLDVTAGLDQWHRIFDLAVSEGDFRTCRSLLIMASELRLEKAQDIASLRLSEGRLLTRLFRYSEALDSINLGIDLLKNESDFDKDDIAQNLVGACYELKGDIYSMLHQYDDAIANLNLSNKAYEHAVALEPTQYGYQINIASNMRTIGDLLLTSGRLEECRKAYEVGMEIYKVLPEVELRLPLTQLNYSIFLRSLADFLWIMNKKAQALGAMREAIQVCVDIVRDDEIANRDAEMKLFSLHLGMATYLTQLGRYEEAIDSFSIAIEQMNTWLQRSPDDIVVVMDRAIALEEVGHITFEKGDTSKAHSLLTESILALEYARHKAPDYPAISYNLGHTLNVAARLNFQLGNFDEALSLINRAVEAAKESTLRTPENANSFDLLGTCSTLLGEINCNALNQAEEISQELVEVIGASFDVAIESYSKAIDLAPHNLNYMNNLGNCLTEVGIFQNEFEIGDDGLSSFRLAVEALREASERTQNPLFAINLGRALYLNAVSCAELGEEVEAIRLLEEAISVVESTVAENRHLVDAQYQLAEYRLTLIELVGQNSEEITAQIRKVEKLIRLLQTSEPESQRVNELIEALAEIQGEEDT